MRVLCLRNSGRGCEKQGCGECGAPGQGKFPPVRRSRLEDFRAGEFIESRPNMGRGVRAFCSPLTVDTSSGQTALFLEACANAVLACFANFSPRHDPRWDWPLPEKTPAGSDFTRKVKPSMLILWVLQWSGGARATVPALIMASGPFAKVVLAILLIMSVYSWAVIWNRTRLYARVERADRDFLGEIGRAHV